MSYKVCYGDGACDYHISEIKEKRRKRFLAPIVVCILLIGLVFLKGRIADLLIPGDDEVTRRAFQVFVARLQSDGIAEAVDAFCRMVIHEANLS